MSWLGIGPRGRALRVQAQALSACDSASLTFLPIPVLSMQTGNRMAALAGSDSPLALGVQAIATSMEARTAGLLTTATANTLRLDSLSEAVSTAQVAVSAVPSTLAATVSSMTNTMDTRITAVLASLASTATALEASSASTATSLRASAATTAAALTAAQVAGASTLTAAVTTQLRAVNVSIAAVNVALVGKRSAASHMWVGSCSNNGNGGWREYCYDRALHDSARPMFRKESNARMRSILAGCKLWS